MRAHMAGNPGTAAKENIWGGMEWNGGGGGGREDGYQAQPCAHQHGVVKHIRVTVGALRSAHACECACGCLHVSECVCVHVSVCVSACECARVCE